MRTPLHHPLSTVFLSAILGWIPSSGVRCRPRTGPVKRPIASALARLLTLRRRLVRADPGHHAGPGAPASGPGARAGSGQPRGGHLHVARRHHDRAVQGSGAGLGRELPAVCERRLLRRDDLPPREARVHDPGGRLHRRRWPRSRRARRSRTRPPTACEHARDRRDGAHSRALRSATSQFYINVADNRSLDHRGFSPDEFGYAVFGRVLAGMDVVDRIAAVATRRADGMEDVPVDAGLINERAVVDN